MDLVDTSASIRHFSKKDSFDLRTLCALRHKLTVLPHDRDDDSLAQVSGREHRRV